MKNGKKFKIRKNYFSSIAKILSFYKTANIETVHPDVHLIELHIIDEIIEKMKKHSSDLALFEIGMIFRACHYLDTCLYGSVAFNNNLPEFQAFIDPWSELDETFEELSPLFVQAGIISSEDGNDEAIPQDNPSEIGTTISSLTVSIDELQESLRGFKNEGLQYVRISFSEAEEFDEEIFPSTLHLEAFSESCSFSSSCDSIESVEV